MGGTSDGAVQLYKFQIDLKSDVEHVDVVRKWAVTCRPRRYRDRATTDGAGERAVIEGTLLVEGWTAAVGASVEVTVKVWSVRCNSISGASREDEGEGISDGQSVVDKPQSRASIS